MPLLPDERLDEPPDDLLDEDLDDFESLLELDEELEERLDRDDEEEDEDAEDDAEECPSRLELLLESWALDESLDRVDAVLLPRDNSERIVSFIHFCRSGSVMVVGGVAVEVG